jgi:uncharacterized repeat protein (TIGR01451 family)
MKNNAGGAAHKARTHKATFLIASAMAAGSFASPAFAGGTVAGTNIDNVATATWDGPDGDPDTVNSNIVSLKVDELLDVAVASAEPGDVASFPGATLQLLRFTLTNAGNGDEAFALSAVDNGGGDQFDPDVTSILLDSNGNGAFDAGIDSVYVPGANDPELSPDESVAVFILSTIPLAAQNGERGRVDLKAVAKTGSGTPGTSFAGQGQGGGDAVVGATGADGEDDAYYAVAKAAVTFLKSATVADAFGGATKVPGSVITYTLTATVTGSGSLANLKVTDPIPAGTTYQPGTIELDGSGLTDAADADAGAFSSSNIAVSLGSVAAGATRTVKFKVKID